MSAIKLKKKEQQKAREKEAVHQARHLAQLQETSCKPGNTNSLRNIRARLSLKTLNENTFKIKWRN